MLPPPFSNLAVETANQALQDQDHLVLQARSELMEIRAHAQEMIAESHRLIARIDLELNRLR